MKIWKILDFLFPPYCLHCNEKSIGYFCRTCSVYFELIDPKNRCISCFAEKNREGRCSYCIQHKYFGMYSAAACDATEATLTLVRGLKNGRMPYLAKTAAAFMAVQLERMQWPMPDYIIPIPKRSWIQRDNHAKLLGYALHSILKIPQNFCLRRLSGDLSKFKNLAPNPIFYLKKNPFIEEKVVLIIDDLIDTGETLHRAASLLRKEGYVKKVYCLAFARTMKES